MTIQDGVLDPRWPPAAILEFGRHFEEFVFIFQSDTHKESILHMKKTIYTKNDNFILKTTTPFLYSLISK